MIRKIAMVLMLLITVILEAVPYGVTIFFCDDGFVDIVKKYAYFDLTPYAYGRPAPFITAVLTCIVLILCVIYCFNPKRKLNIAVTATGAAATIISFLPLINGFKLFTYLGATIFVMLLCAFILSAVELKKKNQ